MLITCGRVSNLCAAHLKMQMTNFYLVCCFSSDVLYSSSVCACLLLYILVNEGSWVIGHIGETPCPHQILLAVHLAWCFLWTIGGFLCEFVHRYPWLSGTMTCIECYKWEDGGRGCRRRCGCQPILKVGQSHSHGWYQTLHLQADCVLLLLRWARNCCRCLLWNCLPP